MINLVLDSNVLGKVCHPRPENNRPVADWLLRCLNDSRYQVVLPEIADYEYRRLLLWRALYKQAPEARVSLNRLDRLKREVEFLRIDSDTMLLAAELWAEARGSGLSIDSEHALSADLILAAQTRCCGNAQVVTENRRHLSRFVAVFPLALHLS